MPVAGNMVWAVKVWIDSKTHKLQIGPPTYYPKERIETDIQAAADALRNSSGAVVYLKFFGGNVSGMRKIMKENSDES